MLKRFFTICLASAVVALSASAQSLAVFNHLGADLSVSTTGIGVELSTPITSWVQMRAGVSFLPSIKFNTDVDGSVTLKQNDYESNQRFDMDIEGNLGRTQGDVIFNIYPFGPLNSFFVAAGAYFGGQNIVKLSGHSDEVASWQQQGILQTGWIELGDYKLNLEDNGNLHGALRTKSFRPYLGLGYGRPCPGKRLGFMVELGVQFMGKMKVCQGPNMEEVNVSALDNDDDWQKWIDKVKVYPVLKFTLSGKIF